MSIHTLSDIPFWKVNYSAPIYQKSSYYCIVYFLLQDKKSAPISNIIDWQSISIFTRAISYAPKKIKYKSTQL